MQNYSRTKLFDSTRLKYLNLEWIYINFSSTKVDYYYWSAWFLSFVQLQKCKKKYKWWSDRAERTILRIVLARFGNERDAPSYSRSMFGKIPGHIWLPYVAPLRGPVTQEIRPYPRPRPRDQAFLLQRTIESRGLFPYARRNDQRIASIRSIKNGETGLV